jgi:hypothetical protein
MSGTRNGWSCTGDGWNPNLTPQRRPRLFDAYIDHASLAYEHDSADAARSTRPPSYRSVTPAARPHADTRNTFRTYWPGHLKQLMPDQSEQAEAMAEHLSFLLEGAMARTGLEREQNRLRHARPSQRT